MAHVFTFTRVTIFWTPTHMKTRGVGDSAAEASTATASGSWGIPGLACQVPSLWKRVSTIFWEFGWGLAKGFGECPACLELWFLGNQFGQPPFAARNMLYFPRLVLKGIDHDFFPGGLNQMIPTGSFRGAWLGRHFWSYCMVPRESVWLTAQI